VTPNNRWELSVNRRQDQIRRYPLPVKTAIRHVENPDAVALTLANHLRQQQLIRGVLKRRLSHERSRNYNQHPAQTHP